MPTHLSQTLEEAKKAGKLSPASIAMAQAYGDAWDDDVYGKYVLQVVPDAMDQLLKDADVQQKLKSMVERKLNWRGTEWVSPAEWAGAAKLFVPGYNAFDAAAVGKWLAKFTGIRVQAAREASVALYVQGDAETLAAMAKDAEGAVSADEISFEAPGASSGKLNKPYEAGDELRLWWD